MKTIRLTAAQALIKYLIAQTVEIDGQTLPMFAGMFAIFGHGNVAGLGEALHQYQEQLPTYRAHNEQAMAHSAIAFAKANNRRRMMACTTSIGPGATNLITACATAHVNRLPVLFLPGDIFASRAPDPVLQQVECFNDLSISANDCFKPVSRFFDRITRPEQLISSLPQALATLTSMEDCGPAVISLCQDTQAQSYDYPVALFEQVIHKMRRQPPDKYSLSEAVDLLKRSSKPLIIAGGGVHYSQACQTLQNFASTHGIPVAFTQAGTGALESQHPRSVGGIGVTGNDAANELAKEADVILSIGSRLQDFTTGSRALIDTSKTKIIQLNVGRFDSMKHHAYPLVADAKEGLERLSEQLQGWGSSLDWQSKQEVLSTKMLKDIGEQTQWHDEPLPTDAQVLGSVNRFCNKNSVVVCAAGGLPGELHKNWLNAGPGTYHLEYGYSCMGYEIAGGLGVKMAHPEKDVYVMVGDGSYLMLNSEIATSVQMKQKLNLIVLDNGGFGCINRLQKACGSPNFNNLVPHGVDFVQHAQSLGAQAKLVENATELDQALTWAKNQDNTTVIVVKTTPNQTSTHGGSWWEVAIPDSSTYNDVNQAHQEYLKHKGGQCSV